MPSDRRRAQNRAAAKARRIREALGIVGVFKAPLSYADIGKLIDRGLLPEAESENRQAVEAALVALLRGPL